MFSLGQNTIAGANNGHKFGPDKRGGLDLDQTEIWFSSVAMLTFSG